MKELPFLSNQENADLERLSKTNLGDKTGEQRRILANAFLTQMTEMISSFSKKKYTKSALHKKLTKFLEKEEWKKAKRSKKPKTPK